MQFASFPRKQKSSGFRGCGFPQQKRSAPEAVGNGGEGLGSVWQCRPTLRIPLTWFAMSAHGHASKDLLEQAAAHLRLAVGELAAQLRPFPPFMGMTSLQAIELEPPPDARGEWGCVVVLPDGEICELELEVIPGPVGPTDVDQVDRYRPLELSAEDYVHFAAAALRMMSRELGKRS